MKNLMISPSGIRGVVGESLTPQLALEVGMSFGNLMGKGPIVVGGDTRTSHDTYMAAVVSGLQAVGTDVISIGKVTTPTVQQLIKIHQAKGGIVITASHNPIIWNGLKLMNHTGSFLTDTEYDTFISYYENKTFKLSDWNNQGHLKHDPNALNSHVNLILSKIDTSIIKSSNLKILIDANNGAGALANPILLDKLGITYKILNSEPNGIFDHDPEPLEKNLTKIIEELKKGDYDIGFVQDADADRLVILDENGRYIGEDYSLAFCVDYILNYEQKARSTKDVVVNLSTSKIIEDIATNANAKIYQTKIGEPNVTAKLKELNAVVGGEGNGGIIYPTIGWGRDSLVGIVIALKYLAETKKTVSEIIKTYPQYKMVREKFTVNNKQEVSDFLTKVDNHFSKDFNLDKQDGVKVLFNTGWIHVRPSNTEPIIRIFIEEKSIERANDLFKEVISLK
jgi:phosphomannomutase